MCGAGLPHSSVVTVAAKGFDWLSIMQHSVENFDKINCFGCSINTVIIATTIIAGKAVFTVGVIAVLVCTATPQ